jgi:phosphoglycerate dehydrogenase-like enzyme
MVVVLVTVDLPEEAIAEISRYAKVVRREDLSRSPGLINEVEAILCSSVEPDVVAKAGRLRFIQAVTAGVDHLPWDQIRPGVTVCSNAGSNAGPVAEHAVGLLLFAVKRMGRYNERIKLGYYAKDEEVDVVYGRRVVILGLGSIGSRIGFIVKSMGAHVVGYNRIGKDPGGVADEVYGEGELEDALRGGDYVFISLPLNKYTRGLVNYDKLSLINRRGVLVNVARAEIVVKEDIRRFLLENPQFTYASDVWWNPGDMRRDADVLGLPNVIATPWVAGGYGSRLVFNHMVNEAVKNLITYLKGGEPRNVVRHEDYR